MREIKFRAWEKHAKRMLEIIGFVKMDIGND